MKKQHVLGLIVLMVWLSVPQLAMAQLDIFGGQGGAQGGLNMAGLAQKGAGGLMVISGMAMISKGSAMMACPCTAAAGAAMMQAGTAMLMAGTALIATGNGNIGTANAATGADQNLIGNLQNQLNAANQANTAAIAQALQIAKDAEGLGGDDSATAQKTALADDRADPEVGVQRGGTPNEAGKVSAVVANRLADADKAAREAAEENGEARKKLEEDMKKLEEQIKAGNAQAQKNLEEAKRKLEELKNANKAYEDSQKQKANEGVGKAAAGGSQAGLTVPTTPTAPTAPATAAPAKPVAPVAAGGGGFQPSTSNQPVRLGAPPIMGTPRVNQPNPGAGWWR